MDLRAAPLISCPPGQSPRAVIELWAWYESGELRVFALPTSPFAFPSLIDAGAPRGCFFDLR